MNKIKVTCFNAEDQQSPRTELFKVYRDKADKVGYLPAAVPINVFFNFRLYPEKPEQLLSHLLSFEDKEFTLLDVTELTEEVTDFEMEAIIYADYITCACPLIQERIYGATGRCAHIVVTPLCGDDFSAPIPIKPLEDRTVAWFGDKVDLMSVRLDLRNNFYPISVGCYQPLPKLVGDTEVFLLGEEEVSASFFERTDIIYLPQTYTPEAEARRLSKVVEATQKGLLVVAPGVTPITGFTVMESISDALDLCTYSGKYPKTILDNQELIRTTGSLEVALTELEGALNSVPEDLYHVTLSDLVEGDLDLR